MRTLKKFNTEAEFNTWKNSPDVRTPYTCLVQDTGNVYYDEGSDDDYSITLVADEDGVVRICGSNIAPRYTKDNTQYVGIRRDGKRTYYEHIEVYKNGVLLTPEELRGTYYLNKNGKNVRTNPYDRHNKGHQHSGTSRRYVEVEKGDIIKIVLDKPILLRGAFNGVTFAKEIVIGNGITQLNDSCFANMRKEGKELKIFLGKNIKTINSKCFLTYKPRFNVVLPKIIVTENNHGASIKSNSISPQSLSEKGREILNI